jgi:hypothetical protein
MNRILLFIAAGIVFTSCHKKKESVTDDTLYPAMQRYYVLYDQVADSSTASASLMPEKQPVNGSTFFEMTKDSAVLANGTVGLLGSGEISRQWNSSGLQDFEFTYTRQTFQYTNHVSRQDVGDAAFDSTAPSSIPLNDTTRFTCTVSPQKSAEKVYLYFELVRVPGVTESLVGFAMELTDGHIELTPHNLQSGKPGTYKMQLKRTRTLVLQEPDHTANGNIEVELLAAERTVTLY